MPKVKTHSGAKRRFKLTKKGIVRHKKAYARHLLTKKSSKRARGLKRPGVVGKSKRGMLHRALPYE